MAISGTQSISQDIWQQLSLQQAQRVAQQAEQNARSLQVQAADARASANRAQENARQLEIKASQAQAGASQAAQNLVQAQSAGQFQAQLSDTNLRISSGLQNAQTQVQSTVNSQGQTIGTVLNVTA